MIDIYTGKHVRLAAVDPEEMSKRLTHWSRDSEYMRLLNGEALRMNSAVANKKWLEKDLEEASPDLFYFTVHSLADNVLIGDIAIEVSSWSARNAFIGLGIGEPEARNKGYGTDLMNVILRFAFMELNLWRVTLNVFEYNPRAIRVYEKAGFRHEGRFRKFMHRDGRRWDMLFMGILREEWMELNKQ